ncbi:MAG: PilZ domain-containing protein [Lachnospiraceae bacterium]|nr:PilZ domain-containing protein [Lachnospiraceae bacterium]
MDEKRKSPRMEMDAVLKLNMLETKKDTSGLTKEEFTVNVLNVSTGGIAFKSKEELKLNTYYDLHLVLWTKSAFDSVIEVVRMENMGGDEIMYGCRFIGMRPSQEMEIQIYQVLQGIQ